MTRIAFRIVLLLGFAFAVQAPVAPQTPEKGAAKDAGKGAAKKGGKDAPKDATQPASKDRAEEAPPAAPGSLEELLPANCALLVSAPSRKRLVDAVAAFVDELKRALPDKAPSTPPDEVVDGIITSLAGATGPLEGIDANRPIGLAVGVDLQRYLLLPAASTEDLKKGLEEGSFVEKGKYIVVTTAGEYAPGKSPLRRVGEGDLVISARPKLWLAAFQGAIDGFVGMMKAQVEKMPGQAGTLGILEAEIEVIQKLLEGTAQLDVALSIESGDLTNVVQVSPTKDGPVRDLFEVFAASEPLDTGRIGKIAGESGFLQLEAFVPPKALRVLLDLIPWSRIAARSEGVKEGDLTALVKQYEKILDMTDGRLAESISMTFQPLTFSGSAVFGVRNAEEFRKAMREFYEGESFDRLTRVTKAWVPDFKLQFEKAAFEVDKLPVDTLVENFTLPGQEPIEIAIQVLMTGKEALLAFAKDAKDSKPIEALLRRARETVPAEAKTGATAVTGAAGSKSFARGRLDWGTVFQAGLQELRRVAKPEERGDDAPRAQPAKDEPQKEEPQKTEPQKGGQPKKAAPGDSSSGGTTPNDDALSGIQVSSSFEAGVGKRTIVTASRTNLPKLLEAVARFGQAVDKVEGLAPPPPPKAPVVDPTEPPPKDAAPPKAPLREKVEKAAPAKKAVESKPPKKQETEK